MHKLLLATLLGASLVASVPCLAAPNQSPIRIASKGAERLIAKAKAERKAERYTQATSTLEQAVSQYPDDYEAVKALGQLEDYLGDYEAAHSDYKKAATLRPEDFEAEVLMAHADVMAEHYDRAKSLCEQLEHHPGLKDAPAWYRSELHVSLGGALGLKAKREGIWAMLRYGMGVRKEMEKALAVDGDNARARYGLGRYFYEAPGAVGGNQGKGLEMLATASRMAPEDWVIRGDYVRDLIHSNRPEAKTELDRFARDFAEHPGAKRTYPDLFAQAK